MVRWKLHIICKTDPPPWKYKNWEKPITYSWTNKYQILNFNSPKFNTQTIRPTLHMYISVDTFLHFDAKSFNIIVYLTTPLYNYSKCLQKKLKISFDCSCVVDTDYRSGENVDNPITRSLNCLMKCKLIFIVLQRFGWSCGTKRQGAAFLEIHLFYGRCLFFVKHKVVGRIWSWRLRMNDKRPSYIISWSCHYVH